MKAHETSCTLMDLRANVIRNPYISSILFDIDKLDFSFASINTLFFCNALHSLSFKLKTLVRKYYKLLVYTFPSMPFSGTNISKLRRPIFF